jgi:hypothetical protein
MATAGFRTIIPEICPNLNERKTNDYSFVYHEGREREMKGSVKYF